MSAKQHRCAGHGGGSHSRKDDRRRHERRFLVTGRFTRLVAQFGRATRAYRTLPLFTQPRTRARSDKGPPTAVTAPHEHHRRHARLTPPVGHIVRAPHGRQAHAANAAHDAPHGPDAPPTPRASHATSLTPHGAPVPSGPSPPRLVGAGEVSLVQVGRLGEVSPTFHLAFEAVPS